MPVWKPPKSSAWYGWKLHLKVRPDYRSTYSDFLKQLEAPTGTFFKIGRSSDQSGKDITVYAGSKSVAKAIAETIEDYLGGGGLRVPVPSDDSHRDDVPFTRHVWGRFDASRAPIGLRFHQYGYAGVPLLEEHAEILWSTGVFSSDAQRDAFKKMALRASDKALRETFGEFYSG